jgi:GNAT superfamily N-acetyltransferase
MTIDALTPQTASRYVEQLIDLMRDAVDGGASIGFLPPLTDTMALSYWQGVIRELGTGNRVLLVGIVDEHVVGSVQLQLANQPNAEHRAEVQKLFVHSKHRGKGYAKALLVRVEEEASRLGRKLLVLDVKAGEPAEALYASHGWRSAGSVPAYSRQADGTLADTTIFFKQV